MSQGNFQGESETFGRVVEFGHEGVPERSNIRFYLDFFLFIFLIVL